MLPLCAHTRTYTCVCLVLGFLHIFIYEEVSSICVELLWPCVLLVFNYTWNPAQLILTGRPCLCSVCALHTFFNVWTAHMSQKCFSMQTPESCLSRLKGLTEGNA